MSLRSYLLGLMVSTIFCWFSFGLILFYINPNEAGGVGLAAFYLSLFFALVGAFTLLGFYLRRWLSRNEILFAHISPAFRQGVLLSLVLVVSLILQAFRILTWWDGMFLVGSVVLLEFFFMSRKTA